jgi:hypothetical protein
MNSREIIWEHAKTYQWMKSPNFGGNPWLDRFARHGRTLIVRYGKSGRVTGAWLAVGITAETDSTPLAPANRNTVMDELGQSLGAVLARSVCQARERD